MKVNLATFKSCFFFTIKVVDGKMQNTSNKKHTVDKKMLREISQEVFQDPSDVNFIFLFLLIYFFFVFEIPRWGFLRA